MFVETDKISEIDKLQEQIAYIQNKCDEAFAVEVEEEQIKIDLVSAEEFREIKHEKKVIPQFTLNHLFDVLSDSRETRADVTHFYIDVVNMVRLGYAHVSMTILTEMEEFNKREWHDLLDAYYPYQKIKKGFTSTEELRGFFDDDMLEFFEEYRPTLLFNDKKLNIDVFLNEYRELDITENTDT